MDIEISSNKSEYERTIEKFAPRILFFNIKKRTKRKLKHYMKFDNVLLENINGVMRKFVHLGLEVGINGNYGEIEYACFYISEKINTTIMSYNINYVEYNVNLIDRMFDTKDIATYFENIQFETFYIKDILYFVNKEACNNLNAYKLGEGNYILLDENNEVSGMVLKKITEKELEIINSTELI